MKSAKPRDPARGSRIRENKRQHRARHKAYVSSLEQSLAELREQGVQATIEVQMAARQVAEENRKLKDLFKRIGFSDNTIGRCLAEAGHLPDGELRLLALQHLSNPASRDDESSPPAAQGINAVSTSMDRDESLSINILRGRCAQLPETHGPSSSVVAKQKSCSKVSCASTVSATSFAKEGDSNVGRPCKLVSLLAENPAADITQISLPAAPRGDADHTVKPALDQTQSVECATAYKMLIQYANSDEKVDMIASALERGCIPSEGGQCRVKTSTIWKALDEHCV